MPWLLSELFRIQTKKYISQGNLNVKQRAIRVYSTRQVKFRRLVQWNVYVDKLRNILSLQYLLCGIKFICCVTAKPAFSHITSNLSPDRNL